MKKKTENPDRIPPSPDFVKAEADWREIETERKALDDKISGAKLAMSLASSPSSANRTPAHLAALAEPFLPEATDRPDNLLKTIADAERDDEKLRKKMPAMKDSYDAACRTETNRVAGLLRPIHIVLVNRMAKAASELSAAIQRERILMKTLAQNAPEPTSSKLPSYEIYLGTGTLADREGPLVAFRSAIQRTGILDDIN